jgi:hypothetical protein
MTIIPTGGVRKFEGVSEFHNACRLTRMDVDMPDTMGLVTRDGFGGIDQQIYHQ